MNNALYATNHTPEVAQVDFAAANDAATVSTANATRTKSVRARHVTYVALCKF
jgi:hypothetical protein